MITGKVWGTTELLQKTDSFEMHRLYILPHARCSFHYHEHKWNAFLLIEGFLTIEVEKKNYKLVDQTPLRPGDLTTVRPGEFHRFVSHNDPVLALEWYWPEGLSEDIIRRDVGGVVKACLGSDS